MSSEKVLVTGGAGYIGSVLVPVFLRAGYEVTVIDTFRFKQTSLLDVCDYPGLIIVRGDARDQDLVAQHSYNADWIIPLAALVGAPLCDRDPENAESTNTGAIRSLIELCDPSWQKIILPNTNSGYGIGQTGIFCDETTPLNPISFYGKTKVEAERIVLESGCGVTLRLATVFGASPRMRVDLLVNEFVYEATKMARAKKRGETIKPLEVYEPHFKRNYIHIRDVVGAFRHAMRHFKSMRGQAYNVGLSDANLSKWELCQKIQNKILEFEFVEGSGKDPDQRNYIVSNAKIEATGFRPRYSLEDGIEELVKCFEVIETKRPEFANV